jgi:prevent-host-death family protein
MNVTQARDQFSQVVDKVSRKEARVLVERSGIPVAAIISADDLKELQRIEAQREARFKIIDQMRDAFKGVPAAEIDCEVDKALAEVRAESRAAEQRVQA